MASSTARSAIIFGIGSNIGTALVKGFHSAGYRVVTVSRSQSSTFPSADAHHIQADLSDPKSIQKVFSEVASAGVPFPSVLIWNAAGLTPPTDPENPFEVDEKAFDRDVALMIKSPYIAAREAVRVWKEAKESDGASGQQREGTFIMTGNLLVKKTLAVPALVTLGIGKNGAYSWLSLADAVLKQKGIRFFFADERKADGSPVGNVPDAEGHANVYLQLTEDEELPTYVTFVDGKYHEFP